MDEFPQYAYVTNGQGYHFYIKIISEFRADYVSIDDTGNNVLELFTNQKGDIPWLDWIENHNGEIISKKLYDYQLLIAYGFV